MNLHKNLTIGADPEFFVSDKSGKFLPAYLTGIKGTKKSPLELPNGGAIQIDGMALEVNIPPASTPHEFCTNVEQTLHEARKIVPKEFNFRFVSSADFDLDVFEDTPDELKQLGCDPDYLASSGQEKTPRPGLDKLPYRCAGGHIHLGWCSDMEPLDLRHMLDCRFTILRVDALDKTKRDYRRIKMYGQSLSFRPKSYGVEWRTPSNDWLNWDSKYLEAWAYLLMKQTDVSLLSNHNQKNIFYKDKSVVDNLLWTSKRGVKGVYHESSSVRHIETWVWQQLFAVYFQVH